MVPSRVRGQGMEKPEVVIDYNSGIGGVDLSDKLSQHKENTKKYYQNTSLDLENEVQFCQATIL
jgi:hypothetical protein